jgi:hypothetical protein
LSAKTPYLKTLALSLWLAICFLPLSARVCKAQEDPYFVTYSDDLEEPGHLEVGTKTAIAAPDSSNTFGAVAMELEYGVRAWWTAEVYLDGQATAQDSAVFTGFRLENRARLLTRDHRINPLIYVEYEDLSAADKTILEFVGHDMQDDMSMSNAVLRREHQHEAELKLILSSDVKNWNISENFIGEKNLGHAPWEFGYAVGVSRPLRSAAREHLCIFCAEKLTAGIEAYGGLGDTDSLTMRATSHYAAPVLGWQLPKDTRLSFSYGIGLTRESLDQAFRVGVAFEIDPLSGWFHGPRERVY